jgi:hypothetical protein
MAQSVVVAAATDRESVRSVVRGTGMNAWRTGPCLAEETYDFGRHQPKEEIDGLAVQVHRAAVSPSATGY